MNYSKPLAWCSAKQVSSSFNLLFQSLLMLNDRFPQARLRSQKLAETVQDFFWLYVFTQVPLATKAFLFLYSMKRRGFKVKKKKRVCAFLFFTAAQSGYLEEDNSPNDDCPPLVPIGCCQAPQQENWGELSLQSLFTVKNQQCFQAAWMGVQPRNIKRMIIWTHVDCIVPVKDVLPYF